VSQDITIHGSTSQTYRLPRTSPQRYASPTSSTEQSTVYRNLPHSASAPNSPTPQFKKLLAPGKIGQILCLGNITDRETYEFLRAIAPDLQIVKGDFDVEAPNLALSKVVTHGSLRIGFTHGHTIIPPGDGDSLLIAARQMDVDVLLWGGTHKFEAYEMEGKFFVNPGSATGAMTTSWWSEEEDPTPSFVLMDVSLTWTLGFRQPANDGLGPRRCARAVRVPAAEGRRGQRERRSREGVVSEKRRWCIVECAGFRRLSEHGMEQFHDITHYKRALSDILWTEEDAVKW
jgi:vacuolar protein sorting-associated protein 29